MSAYLRILVSIDVKNILFTFLWEVKNGERLFKSSAPNIVEIFQQLVSNSVFIHVSTKWLLTILCVSHNIQDCHAVMLSEFFLNIKAQQIAIGHDINSLYTVILLFGAGHNISVAYTWYYAVGKSRICEMNIRGVCYCKITPWCMQAWHAECDFMFHKCHRNGVGWLTKTL